MAPIRLLIAALVLAMVQLATVAVAVDCTEADKRHVYTECENNSMSLIWYWAVPCDVKDVPLPPPVYNIACNVSCKPGQFLEVGNTQCTSCDPGYISWGGGKLYGGINGWGDFDDFITTCSTTDGSPCHAWSRNDTFVESGDNAGFSSSYGQYLESSLQLSVSLVERGNVTFTYRVDSEQNYDGMIFLIDGKEEMPLEMSFEAKYTQYTAQLPVGTHVLKWSYVKDRAISAGADRAFLSEIFIYGIGFFDESCTACPTGYYRKDGTNHCTQCPVNTYASHQGSSKCEACAASEYSASGAVSCTPRPQCTANDWGFKFTKCDGAKRTKHYFWLDPQICTGGITLHANETGIDCADCDAGTYKLEDGSCGFCPEGTWSSDRAESCSPCTAGTAAIKTLHLDHMFYNLEAFNITSGCSGDGCGSKAWRERGETIDSGVGHGPRTDIWLQFDTHIESEGYVTFNYTTNEDRGGALSFYIDDEWKYFSALETPYFVLKVGFHKLKWSYFTYSKSDPNTPGATIESIIVKGVSVGGADGCVTCRNGTQSQDNAHLCAECPAGYTSQYGATKCDICPVGTFSATNASASCTPCGAGTTAAVPGSTVCDIHCDNVQLGNSSYHLTPLADSLSYGPIVSEYHKYFLNLCNPIRSPLCSHLDTFGCQVYEWLNRNVTIDTGHTIAYEEIPPVRINGTIATNATYPHGGLKIKLTEGTLCQHEGVRRSTEIRLVCDQFEEKGVPSVPESGIEDPICHYHWEWRTKYGCRICTDDDFECVTEECKATESGTFQKIHCNLREPGVCLQEYPKVDKLLTCSLPSAGDSGGESPPWVTPVAVLGSLLIIVLLVLLVRLWRRNRSMHAAYERYALQQNNNGTQRGAGLLSSEA
eukprot:GFYU01005862.1.p1 GENE.GFYU01005862.1~~GFYU01005862.1.p1  ORF type:complete len:914 (+),score=216.63 GFYU01005862.1:113-2743(+)